jgi:uncharacterized protein YcbK (DUF882 family)
MATITKNFNINEFKCKDGTPVPSELLKNVIELANNLQIIRDYIDLPITILSAYRTENHNKKVGGAKKSQHLQGKAADLLTELNSKKLYDIIEFLINEGKIKEGGLGLYENFVHYDIRGVKARWQS